VPSAASQERSSLDLLLSWEAAQQIRKESFSIRSKPESECQGRSSDYLKGDGWSTAKNVKKSLSSPLQGSM
jgi:hypothetical protein